MCGFLRLLFPCVSLYFALYIQQILWNVLESFCLSLSLDSDLSQFIFYVIQRIYVFSSMVYLKLLLGYIEDVSLFLVIATAAPSNKKIFSDEFLNKLKNELVGTLKRDQFQEKSMYYCLSLHSLQAVGIVNINIQNQSGPYSDVFQRTLVLGYENSQIVRVSPKNQ